LPEARISNLADSAGPASAGEEAAAHTLTSLSAVMKPKEDIPEAFGRGHPLLKIALAALDRLPSRTNGVREVRADCCAPGEV
jgi:hypothetical protein